MDISGVVAAAPSDPKTVEGAVDVVSIVWIVVVSAVVVVVIVGCTCR
jgi:hypothetical protein